MTHTNKCCEKCSTTLVGHSIPQCFNQSCPCHTRLTVEEKAEQVLFYNKSKVQPTVQTAREEFRKVVLRINRENHHPVDDALITKIVAEDTEEIMSAFDTALEVIAVEVDQRYELDDNLKTSAYNQSRKDAATIIRSHKGV